MPETDLRSLPDPRDLFDLIEVVGTGTYGQVFKGRHKNTGQLAAIKILELIEDEEEEIKVEIDVLADHSKHENITSFYGTYLVKTGPTEEDKLWLAMEFCGGGSITDLCKNLLPKKLPEPVFSYVMHETLKALEYLHDNGIIHRDVKGQNILMTDDGNIRLIDFGVSAKMKENQTKRNTFIGTPYWMAPEVIATDTQDDAFYDTRSDIWSLGITAIEIADTEPPLSDMHPMRALFLIPRNKAPELPDKRKWSREINQFVGACLEKDYEKRSTAKKLLLHPFIKSVNKNVSRSMTTELIDKFRNVPRKTVKDEEDDASLGPDNKTSSLKSEASSAGLKLEDPSMAQFDPDRKAKTHVNEMLGLAGSTGDSKEGAIHRPTSLKGSVSTTKLDDMIKLQAQQVAEAKGRLESSHMYGSTEPEAVASPAVNIPGFGNFGLGSRPNGGAEPATGPITQMPEIRKFKRSFNSEILCASFWHSNLVVGTKNGLLLLDRSEEGKVHPLISRRRFTNMDVLEDVGVMVTTSGKRDKLRAYSLAYFRQAAIDKAAAKKMEQFSSIGGVEGCISYQVARYDRMVFLCAAHGLKISVFLWAPAPYSKFMVFKEFEVPLTPKLVDLSVGEDQQLKLLFASSTGFYSIDVTSGTVLNLFVPIPQPKNGIQPLAIHHIPNEEGLERTFLVFDDTAAIVDKYGDITDEIELPWAEEPHHIGIRNPQSAKQGESLLAWGLKSIEIRSPEDGELVGVFKHKRATRLRFLCSRTNKVFFAAVRNGGCQIYFMMFK
eukprot:m.55852 g.55852  ORF g.55852 m.55852 type:complete len:776 (+) comp11007_c0_seq1:213-2540(+)